jgi:hypothetical protein
MSANGSSSSFLQGRRHGVSAALDEGGTQRAQSWHAEGQSAALAERSSSFDHEIMLRASTAKDRATSFAADARLGAQVLRVRSGIDAKIQEMRENKPVSRMLAKVGITKMPGVPCDPPRGAEGDVLELFNEDPSLRERIQNFHHTQAHMEMLLPALEEYQRHRRGLAEAEQRICIALQEAGQRAPGEFGQALQECGSIHRKIADRRLQAWQTEEQGATSVLRNHCSQAVDDCKRSLRDYEAARQELRVLYEARARARSVKQTLEESGAAKVDSFVSPHVDSSAQLTEDKLKQKVQATSETAAAKIAMIEVKHTLEYANSLALHLTTLAEEEHDCSQMLLNIPECVSVIKESATHADLVT